MHPLAERVEHASLEASAPSLLAPYELEGWHLSFTPGPTPVLRALNLTQAGRLPLDELLKRCSALQPLLLRISPWSQPRDLDAQLAARGFSRTNPIDVLLLEQLPAHPPELGPTRLERLSPLTYAQHAAQVHGITSTETIEAHAQRLQNSPLPYQNFALYAASGELLVCGQSVIQGELLGLFGIHSTQRRQGHARRFCHALLHLAHAQGARHAYLQVAASNAPAQALYAQLGFVRLYGVHFRKVGP